MTQPIESIAKVAATPEQAKVYVAMLQGAGIPARSEGDNLVDEFATARRLMNLMGTRVMVPTGSLARAQELLQPVAIDPDELAQQALAAAGDVETAPRKVATDELEPTGGRWIWIALLVLPILTGLVIAIAR
jgi:hypothetical protein